MLFPQMMMKLMSFGKLKIYIFTQMRLYQFMIEMEERFLEEEIILIQKKMLLEGRIVIINLYHQQLIIT